MTPPRVLIAGIGNVFLGDDGFGVEVVRRLQAASVPAGVAVVDYGIRGMHLAYALLDGVDVLIMVDAVPLGEPPGTVAVLEVGPDAAGPPVGGPAVDAHGMTPAAVLELLSALGGRLGRTFVVGCQPATLDEGMGLSGPVQVAVTEAARLALELAGECAPTETSGGVSPPLTRERPGNGQTGGPVSWTPSSR